MSTSLGFIVLLGWATRSTLLIQLKPHFAPMQFNTASCFALSGLALLLTLWDSKRRNFGMVLLGGMVAAIGNLTLIEYAFDVNVGIDQLLVQYDVNVGISHPGRMGPNTAQAFAIVGSALILAGFFTPSRIWIPTAVGLLGILVGLIGGAGLTGYFLGTDSTFGWYQWTRMALHTASGFLMLAVGLQGVAGQLARRCASRRASPRIAYAVAVTVMLAMLGFWSTLVYVERTNIRLRTEEVSAVARRQLQRELQHRIQTIERMAFRWQQDPDLSPTFLANDAEKYCRHSEFVRAIQFLSPEFQSIAVAGLDGVGAVLNDPSFQDCVGKARLRNEPLFCVPSAGTQRGVVLIMPVFGLDQFLGYVVATFDNEKLFRYILEDVAPAYAIEAALNGNAVFNRTVVPSALGLGWEVESVLPFAGIYWRLGVTPGKAMISATQSVLPLLVLMFGVAFAFLIAMTVHLAQHAGLRAEEAELAQHRMEVESGVRRAAEERLRVSEERYALAVRASSNGVWDWNLETDEDYLSDRWMELLGYEPGALARHISTWESAIHPDDRERVRSALDAHLTNGVPYAPEMRLRSHDGSYRWYQSRGEAIRNGLGKPIRMAGFIADIHDRKLAELDLVRSEARFRSLTEAVPHMVWTATAAGRNEYFNQQWLNYTGLTLKESIGWGWQWALHPEDREICMRRWNLALQTGKAYEIECRFKRASDASYRWHLGRAVAVCDDDGNVLRWIGTCTDIEDQKRIEQALRDSQEKFRVLAEVMPQLVWSTLPDGQADYFNHRWCQYTGLSVQESEGAGWIKSLHPDEHHVWLRAWKHSMETGKPFEVQRRIRRGSDGAYRWYLSRAMPIRDERGAITRWFGTSTDIHAQKEIEVELTLSERRFRTLAEAIPQIVWAAGAEGSTDYFNQRWYDYTGLTLEQAGGSRWLEVIHPEDRAHCVEQWRNAITTGSVFDVEYRFRRGSDGAYRWHLGRGLPVRDENGKIVRWFGTATDIEEQKLTQRALLRSQNRYRSLAIASGKMVWSTSPEHEHGTPHLDWTALTGQTPQEAADWGWLAAIHPDDRALTRSKWEHAQVSLTEHLVEYRVRLVDGSYRYYRIHGVPITGERAGDVEWIGTAVDIHDQKMAQEQIQRSEERYRSLVSVLSSVVWTADAAGCFVTTQDSWQAYTGQAFESHSGRGWITSFHPDDQEIICQCLERALSNSSGFRAEGRVWHASSGQYRYVTTCSTPLLYADGTVREWVGTMHDVDDQRRAEEALLLLNRTLEDRIAERTAAAERRAIELEFSEDRLRHQTEILQSILDGMADGAVVSDLKGRLLQFNPAARAIIGRGILESSPAQWSSAYGLFKVDRTTMCSQEELPLACALRGIAVDDVEIVVRNPELAADVWITASARPLRDSKGDIWGGVVVFHDISLGRRMQEALRRSEERLRLALSAARMGTWEWEPATGRLSWSEHDTPVMGLVPEKHDGVFSDLVQLVHPDDRVYFQRNVDAIDEQAPGTLIKMECRIIPRSQKVHWLAIYGTVFPSADGRSTHVMGTFFDVSERRQNESFLRLQSAIAANMAEGVCLVRAADHVIVFTNAKFDEMFGYEKGELWERPVSIVNASSIHTPEEIENTITSSLHAKGEWTGEVHNVRKDGTEFWCRANTSAFEHPEHGLVFIAVHTDITEEKAAKHLLAMRAEELVQSRESLWTQTRILRSVLDSMREAVIVADESGRLVLHNRAAEAVYGSPVFQPIACENGLTCESERNLESAMSSPMNRAIRGESVDDAEMIIRSETIPEGRVFNINGRPILGHDGSSAGGVIVLHDITERRQVEEAIHRTLHEKDLLLKEIHHRVKNNLQVISSLLNLQSNDCNDDKVRAIFDESQNRVRSMALIHESLYRSDDLTRVDFGEYIRSLSRNLFDSYSLPGRVIRFRFDIEPLFLGIDDAIPCGLILNELLTNALKHAFHRKSSGTISVGVRSLAGAGVQLRVRDDGDGLPTAIDFQSTKTLGVRLVRNLTDQLRGKLDVEHSDGFTATVTFVQRSVRVNA